LARRLSVIIHILIKEGEGMSKTVRFCVILYLFITMAFIANVPQSQASVVAGPIANPANGHFYYLLSNSTWAASETEAVSLGGHLATIRSLEENNWVYNTFSTYCGGRRDLWTGLNDLSSAGSFIWVSGESSGYTNWGSGQPDNTGTERYGYIMSPISSEPGLWNNGEASSTTNGVAEVIKPLSSLAITAGPDSVYQISQASYTATATFGDGSTAAVTATWSVDPTTYASIDSGGILTTQHVPSDQNITITASFTTGGITKTATKDVTIAQVQTPGMVYFSDDFEGGLGKWVVSGSDWDVIDDDARSGTHCITDSPEGSYPPNANSIIRLKTAINLSSSTAPILSFWTVNTLNADDGYVDYGYVEVSENGGLNWDIVLGSFAYSVSTWIQYRFDLSAYKSKPILIRFHLVDDARRGQADGWYVDDVEIREKDTTATPFPFFDDFESGLGKWLVSGRDWALVESDYRSAGHSITDSPSGDYPVNAYSTITLAHPIDLTATTAPILSFWTVNTLNADDGYVDYGYVEVSENGGLNWDIVLGSFAYSVSTWIQYRFDLSAYKSKPILIRFHLVDDARRGQADGWYVDDVEIREKDTTATPFPFFDDFESGLGKWLVSGRDWALVESDYRSAGHSITDSPSGDYPVNAYSTITLAHPIDLTATTTPILSFWTVYNLNGDDGYVDYGYVEVSDDGGLTWTGLPGCEFAYTTSTWTQVLFDLSAYKSKPILIRFHLVDDARRGQADGWYIDDVAIYDMDTSAPVPGTVTPSNTAYGIYVSGTFDLATTFTDPQSRVTTCKYSTNGGSTWSDAVVSGSGPTNNCTKTGITGTNGQVLTLNMQATSFGGTSFGIGVQVTVDAQPPTNGSLTIAPDDTKLNLSWSGFSDGASGLRAANTYRVVRSSTATPDEYCTNGTQVYLGHALTAQDTGLANHTTYYYRVCAYDNVGNISLGATDNETPLPHHNLTINIIDGGTVNNFDPSTSSLPPCSSATCTASFLENSHFLLRGSPTVSFIGWSGAGCSEGDCSITLTANKSVTAAFTPIVKIVGDTSSYQSLQIAYGSAVSQTPELRARNFEVDGDFILNSFKNVILNGGYTDASFTSATGYSTIKGILTIEKGSLVVDRLIVK
jgi:hypothetical protein